MAPAALSHLFSPIRIRGLEIKNRILSTGHDTTLITGGVPNDALIAYHEARAKGGVGLIVVQAAGIHETAKYTSHVLMASEASVPGYRQLAETVHKHGCKIFGQLFHPGREIMESQDGSAPVAYAPSAARPWPDRESRSGSVVCILPTRASVSDRSIRLPDSRRASAELT